LGSPMQDRPGHNKSLAEATAQLLEVTRHVDYRGGRNLNRTAALNVTRMDDITLAGPRWGGFYAGGEPWGEGHREPL